MLNIWIHDDDKLIYEYTFKENSTFYKVVLDYTEFWKTLEINVAVASGTKKKYLKNFDNNKGVRKGEVKALLRIRDLVLSIETNYNFFWNRDNFPTYIKKYIHIGWVDNQRRNVYSRMLKYGYTIRNVRGEKILIKKF